MHLSNKKGRHCVFMDNNQNNNNLDQGMGTQDKIQDTTEPVIDDPTISEPEIQNRDEETAAELTNINQNDTVMDDDKIEDQTGGELNSVIGWAGLVLAVLSFFMMPIILGGAAIIVGFVARSRDAEWLGNTAIAVGVISIIVRLFIMPFV